MQTASGFASENPGPEEEAMSMGTPAVDAFSDEERGEFDVSEITY